MPQGVFGYASTDPVGQHAPGGSNSANFWMDVQVSVAPPDTGLVPAVAE